MSAFRVRAAVPRDIPDLMRLKRLLAEGEGSGHAVRATEADWLRDGFDPSGGFSAYVAEITERGGETIIGMATCSERVVTGWNGPVLYLQDLYVEARYRKHGIARALMTRVAALARDIGSPIVELTVRADNPSAQMFYLRAGFMPLPHCLTFVLGGSALGALAAQDRETPAPPVNPAAVARSSARRQRPFQSGSGPTRSSTDETSADNRPKAAWR